LKERAEESVAQPHGTSDDRIENRLRVSLRLTDHAQDLSRRRLLLERLGHLRVGLRERAVLILQFREQARVLVPAAVMQYLSSYVSQYLPSEVEEVKPDTPLFWSTYGRRHQGIVRQPMEGKNVWRLCKAYGRLIGYPMLKPHDLRHGVAMEVYEERHDLEEVRGLLGHKSIETTQLYAQIRPAGLTHAVNFYEAKALDVLSS
jgi:site-specific recombinase XerD